MAHRLAKWGVWTLCLISCWLSLALPLWGVPLDAIPNPRQVNGGWVADTANVLSPDGEARLNQIIDQLEATNGSEIAVVTLANVPADMSARQVATTLLNQWGVGKAGQDNGLLFLVAVNERRVEVETGYGLEAYLSDGRVGRILDTDVVPHFRRGDYEAGILAGTQTFADVLLAGDFIPGVAGSTPTDGIGGVGALVGLAISFLGFNRCRRLANRQIHLLPTGFTRTTTDPTQPPAVLLLIWGSIFVGLLALLCLALVLLVGLTVGGFVLVLLGSALLASVMTPLLRSLTKRHQPLPVYCATCEAPLDPIAADVIQARLTPPQVIAQDLGTVMFKGWQCPICSDPDQLLALRSPEDRTTKFHLYAIEQPSPYHHCPRCQEKTLWVDTKTIRRPTATRSGLRRTTKTCKACDYQEQKDHNILPPPPPMSGPGSGGNGFGGGSFGGGSSGGGSFGGGSSGGGGAGRSW